MDYFERAPTIERLIAAALVSLIGVSLFVLNVFRLLSGDGPLPALVLATVGTLLSAVLILAGYSNNWNYLPIDHTAVVRSSVH